jgi:hypothetical protein
MSKEDIRPRKEMLFKLVAGILGVWRMTHLLNKEDGPNDFILLTRQRAGEGFLGSLLGCFFCLSLWVAMPFALLISRSWKERLFYWPSLSAGAILLELVIEKSRQPPPAHYLEDPEV